MLNFAEQTGSGAVMLVWSYPPVLVQQRDTNVWPTWRQNKKVARYDTLLFFTLPDPSPDNFFHFIFHRHAIKKFCVLILLPGSPNPSFLARP